jgi:hypothetical protein
MSIWDDPSANPFQGNSGAGPRGTGSARGTGNGTGNGFDPAGIGQGNGLDLGEWDFGAANIVAAELEPRGWLLGTWICRQFVSMLMGDGAVGKTANRIACALALAANRSDILKEHVFERCRVLFLCFEDGEAELKRRICGAMLHHKISNADITGHLFVKAITNSQLKLAIGEDFGKIERGPLIEAVKTSIARRAIDAVFFDPFVKTHSLNENNNAAMDLVIEILADLAIEHDLAVDAPHHVRKGPPDPGNADAGRGASAIKDGGRLVYTQTPMSREEAKLYSLSEEERLSLVRVDQGKVNLVRRSAKPKWLKLVGVKLGNTFKPTHPNGDEVQTVEVWDAPDPLNLPKTQIAEILTKLRKGPCPGERYSPETNSNDWVGIVIKTVAKKSEEAAALLLKNWFDNEMLLKDRYKSPLHHNKRVWGVWVNEAKARDILGNLYQPPTAKASEDIDIAELAAEGARTANENWGKTKKPSDLTDNEQLALQLLRQAIADRPGAETVPYTVWRQYADRARFSENALARLLRSLLNKGAVQGHQTAVEMEYGCSS